MFPSPYGDLFYFYGTNKKDKGRRWISFPSPMGIFFISIMIKGWFKSEEGWFPSPMGIFFISIGKRKCVKMNFRKCFRPLWGSFLSLFMMIDYLFSPPLSFRPLWGSFLFLFCPMETLPGIEKTCTLRCKRFSPVKSGDSKLVNCSDP